MSEEVEIDIELSSSYWEDRYPGARVYIDESMIFEGLISEPTTIKWSGPLDDSTHKISIEMYNKKPDDTVTDADENIVNDVLLNVNSISLDDIDLDLLLWTNSRYRPTDPGAPSEVKECVNLGWNGVWELEFSSPIYMWLLENL